MLKLCNSFDGRGGSTHHLHQIKMVAYVIPSGGELGSTYYESTMEFAQLERGNGQIYKCKRKLCT